MFNEDDFRLALAQAYREANVYVPNRIQQLVEMIRLLESLNPTCATELHNGATLVVEEFADERDQPPTC